MAAVNSLLFLFTTLASFTDPPEGDSITPSPPEWNNDLVAQLLRQNDLPPCVPDVELKGEMECPTNEHYESCGHVCMESCIKYECPLTCCVEGCFCDEGYVRGYNGTCTKRENCYADDPQKDSNKITDSDSWQRKQCGPDEYIGCESMCERNCSNYHDVITCPRTCVLDCVCRLPKIRGPDGSCIFHNQCPSHKLTRMAEVDRDRVLLCNFMRIMSPEVKECPFEAKKCTDPHGCSNETGGIHTPERTEGDGDDDTACLPQTELRGPFDCPPGEHYEECGPICIASCIRYDCPIQCCAEGCFCEEGYARGINSSCIPIEECPEELLSMSLDSHTHSSTSCGPDEVISCESTCQRNCDNYRADDVFCPEECVMGCVCIPPKIRGPDGDCILSDECPAPPLTSLEEHMKNAATICNFLHIMESPPSWSDTCPMIVSGAAVCPENEEFRFCGTPCPKNCSNYSEDRPCIQKCSAGCFCEEPRVRGPDGTCVLIEDCPRRLKEPFHG